jgi:hypothetical protein
VYFLGLRLNTYIASALAVIGLVWFWRIQRRPDPEPAPDSAPAEATAEPDAPADAAAEPADAAPEPAPSQESQETHDSESTHG